MLRHSLLILFRNFKRYKSASFINLFGLSVGLASALLIYLWVNDELSIDKFHEDDDRIFQVYENLDETDGINTNETTSGYMASAMMAEMPEVELAAAVTTIKDKAATLSVEDKRINIKATGLYVSKEFFQVFSYPFIDGDKNRVWENKNSMIISEELALKMFGTTEGVIGNIVDFEHEQEFFVSAVFETLPSQSSDQFDFVLSFEEHGDRDPSALEWRSTPAYTYVKLRADASPEGLNAKIKDFVAIKTGGELTHRKPFLVRYSDRYLYGNYENGVQSGGRIAYVRLFSIIAIFILTIACINFMNLSTAKASRRLKEVGVKKAMGVNRKVLIFQYLSESLMMCFISLIIALILVLLLLPDFNEITGKQLVLALNLEFVLSVLAVVLFTGLASGSYPALYLSGFKPAVVLKGKLNSSTGEMWTRKGLVVLQFGISVVLIVSVLVIYKQIEYVQTKNLGYDRENILLFDREGKTAQEEHLEPFLAEVKNIPGVINASVIGHDLAGKGWGVYGFDWEGKDPDDNTLFEHVVLYYDMMQILDIQMKEGRAFSRDFSAERNKIVLNEAAIEHMKIENPVGKSIRFWGRKVEIIGIAKNFHFESLHEEIQPLMFSFWPDNADRFMVKTGAGKEEMVIDRLEELYKEFNPGFFLDYKFLDQRYQAQYVAEQRVAVLSRYFAGLAILISCLGLFGLAAFTIERRSKEIGVRKILGCSQFHIIYLLSGDFTKMILVAVIVALPLSYFLTKNWLDGFAYRIALEWWYFVGSGVLALLITWLTIGFQMVKASKVKLTQSLRDE